MLLNRGLEGFWVALGRFWATGGLPDASKTHVGRSLWGGPWIYFWSIWASLGEVLGRLGEILEDSWGVWGLGLW